MTFGNYDAGQSRPVSNPLPLGGGMFNRGVENTGFSIDFKFTKTEGTKAPWGIERTSSVTPESRVEEAAQKNIASITSTMAESADNDRFVDEMLNPYITAETRARIAGTSFNAAMALGDFEEAYKNLA